ncbi:hypothetical protein N7520_005202 [Penicillium odoratum]|uniref:uncharacterized protein n=1 Tax=Penicillium odoratum TaxID=1167516 RepID=UPI002547E099|nr:uncharacterized protein N7520_005202 [Penicillium odoratum]KAJ5765643.1 hypothetical protein N7520_005202 [Penicillium odoratum]
MATTTPVTIPAIAPPPKLLLDVVDVAVVEGESVGAVEDVEVEAKVDVELATQKAKLENNP